MSEMISFDFMTAAVNFILVGLGAVIANTDGRLTFEQMGPKSLPWIAHGGVWADLLILTPVIGLAMAKAGTWPAKGVIINLIVCIVVTILCHVMWAKAQPLPGHIVEPINGGQVVMMGGYYHAVYMAVVMWIIVNYFTLTPSINLWVPVLMTIFVIPSTLQPGWMVNKILHGRGSIDAVGWIVSAVIWCAIWGTTIVRNAH